MKRIGRVGEKWGVWTLEGRAGISIADGKRAFKASRRCPGAPGYERAVVVIQHRRGKRAAWRIREEALVPELLLGTFQSWHSMLERCCRSTHVSFENYGGRGIWVDSGWDPLSYACEIPNAPENHKALDARIKAFAAFVGVVGVRPAGCSLDRIDVNGHYVPGNVRWACKAIQAGNKR